jgi:hypothetical protein
MFIKEPMFRKNLEPGTHINIFEFFALIITIWLTLQLSQPCEDIIYSTYGDNMSAVSWLPSAARARSPAVGRLARYLQAMLSTCPFPFSL